MPSVLSPFPSSFFDKLAEIEAHHWWFRSRNRVLLWTLKNKIGDFSDFLEVGCGTGYVLEGIRKVYPNAKLVGAEYYEEGLSFARKRIPTAVFRHLDVTTMDETACYDVIGGFDLLEHIEQEKKALLNFVQALRPRGRLLITVPQHNWLWSQADDYACHVRRYSRNELIKKINQAGLEVDYVTSFVSILIPVMWLSRLRKYKGKYDPMNELTLHPWLNKCLEAVMHLELFLLKAGVSFPIGGSLLLVARKP